MRSWLFAAALLVAIDAHAASISPSVTISFSGPMTIGETTILPNGDGGNANLLIAQNAALPQPATIQSLSFYVATAAGSLRLGVYDATGPSAGPGALKAQTASFTPVTGWNTKSVTIPVLLPVGTYWLAYLPSSNSLAFRKAVVSGTSAKYHTLTFGSMPATFPASPLSDSAHWSFYATLTAAPSTPTLSLSFAPPAPSIPSTSPLGTFVSAVTATWSDGSPFTGSLSFVPPYSDDGGLFALSGHNLIINPSGPGASMAGNTVQHATLMATQ